MCAAPTWHDRGIWLADGPSVVLIAAPFGRTMAALADRFLRARCTVLWRPTVADALRCLSERRVDIVLAAPVLADGDWTRLSTAVTQRPGNPPLVLVTA